MKQNIFLTLLMTLCSPLVAVTTTWNASGGGNWSEAANWTNGVPTIADTAVFPKFSGFPSITIVLDANAEVDQLQFNPAFEDAMTNYTISDDGNSRVLSVNTSGILNYSESSFTFNPYTTTISANVELADATITLGVGSGINYSPLVMSGTISEAVLYWFLEISD